MHEYNYNAVNTRVCSPVGCPEILASLINQCTRIQSEERPTFTEILEFCKKKDLSTIMEEPSAVVEQSSQL